MWTSYEVNEDAMSGHSVLAGHSRRAGSYKYKYKHKSHVVSVLPLLSGLRVQKT